MLRFAPDPPIPGQPCAACGGRAWVWDSYRESHGMCPHCDGMTTTGVFVIQIVSGGRREERSWQTRDYLTAAFRARRMSRWLGVVNPDTDVQTVSVVYRATNRPGSCQPCERCGGIARAKAGQGDGIEVYTRYVVRVRPAPV